MRLLLAVLLGAGTLLNGAIGFVASSTASCSASATSCATASFSVASGNTIVVGYAIRTTTSTANAPTDGPGNTYTKVNGCALNNSTNIRMECWATSVNGSLALSSQTVTCHLSATSQFSCVVAAYSGASLIGTVATATSGSASPTSPAITTQDTNDWCVGFYSEEGTSSAFSASTGNLRVSVVNSTSSAAAIMDQTQASAGASCTTKVTYTGTVWSLGAIELRTASTAAKTATPSDRALARDTAVGLGAHFATPSDLVTPNAAANGFAAHFANKPLWPNGYTYRTTAAIAAGQVTGTLTSYPALLSLSSAQLATAANSGSIQHTVTQTVGSYTLTVPADFLVTSDPAGVSQIVGVEFESYSASAGTALVWVNVPSATVGAAVYLWYGNAAVTTLQGTPSSTWNSNYAGVFHFPNGTSLTLSDSTVNANNFSVASGSPTAGTGTIDGAASLPNSTTGMLSGASALTIVGGTAITVSTWTNWTSPVSGTTSGFGAHNTSYLQYNSSSQLSGSLNLTAGTISATSSGVTFSSATWYKLDLVYDGTNLFIYVNGVLRGTSGSSMVSTVQFAQPGYGGADGGNPFFGLLDEARWSNTNLSASWIAADYNNQNAPGTFWSIVYDAMNYVNPDIVSFFDSNSYVQGTGGTPFFGTASELLVLLDRAAGLGTHYGSVWEHLLLADKASGLGAHFNSTRDMALVADKGVGLGAHVATVFDTSRTLDLSSGLGSHFTNTVDLLRVYDVAGKGAYANKLELLVFVDSDSGFSAHFATPKDTVKLLDLPVGLGSHFGQVTDLLRLSEAAGKGSFASKTELLTFSDTSSGLGSHFASTKDLFRLLDLATRTGTFSRATSDLMPVGTLSLGFGAHIAQASDFGSLHDASVGHGAHQALIQDTLTFYDSSVGHAGHFMTVYELVTTSDGNTAFKVKLIFVVDSLQMLSTASGFGAHFAVPSDLVRTSDLGSRLASLHLSTQDSAALLTIPSGLGAHYGLSTDVARVLDFTSQHSGYIRNGVDGLSLLDTAGTHGIHFGTALEAFSTLGVGAGSSGHFAVTTDYLATMDLASRVSTAIRSSTDSLLLSIVASRVGSHFAATSELLNIFDCNNGCGFRVLFAAALEQLAVVNVAAGLKAAWNPVIERAGVYLPPVTLGKYGGQPTTGIYVPKDTSGVYVIVKTLGVYIKKITTGVVK